jgi:hypothetical protein
MTMPVTIKHEKWFRLFLFHQLLAALFKGGHSIGYPERRRSAGVAYQLAISRQLSGTLAGGGQVFTRPTNCELLLCSLDQQLVEKVTS